MVFEFRESGRGVFQCRFAPGRLSPGTHYNYVKAICKIIRDSDAEDLLVTAGLCLKGTANKMFGDKADYYQTMHAIRILSEAMWRMYWEHLNHG